MRCAARVVLGLGSNLGERLAHLREAVEQLSILGLSVQRVSSVFEARYIGSGGEQPRYLNIVLVARTMLLPHELLRATQRLEMQHGRKPGSHMKPRPLDVDILFYGGWIIRQPDLVVPHPRVQDRRFVLEPLGELGFLRQLPLPALGPRLAELQQEQELAWYCEWPLPGESLDTVQF